MGSGSPALFGGSSLTVACYYLNTSGGYTFEETENADGPAYPGQFVAGSPLTVSPLVTVGGIGRYVTDNNLAITGTEKIVTTDLERALVTWSQTKFYLQAWTAPTQAMPRHTLPVRRAHPGAYVGDAAVPGRSWARWRAAI